MVWWCGADGPTRWGGVMAVVVAAPAAVVVDLGCRGCLGVLRCFGSDESLVIKIGPDVKPGFKIQIRKRANRKNIHD
ncbi:hypothetical protein P8452_37462 [Trifolium repens]|nr:hypothetical protein P8452_37462 [Trifolium repens]